MTENSISRSVVMFSVVMDTRYWLKIKKKKFIQTHGFYHVSIVNSWIKSLPNEYMEMIFSLFDIFLMFWLLRWAGRWRRETFSRLFSLSFCNASSMPGCVLSLLGRAGVWQCAVNPSCRWFWRGGRRSRPRERRGNSAEARWSRSSSNANRSSRRWWSAPLSSL